MPVTLASFDEDEAAADSGNFDLLLEFRPDEFKDFSDIAKQLNEFRKQSVALKQRWSEVSNRVRNYDTERAKIDETIKFFPDDEAWKARILEVKDVYTKQAQYDKAKEELADLDAQLNATETISKEFKISATRDFTCAVCYENPVNLFLDPCGHMTCGPCWSKVPNRHDGKHCPCCRAPSVGKKIYLV
jgi:hypothetical protein